MCVCVCAFECTRVCVCVKGSEFGQVRVQQSKSLVALETGRGVREGSGGEDLMLEKERKPLAYATGVVRGRGVCLEEKAFEKNVTQKKGLRTKKGKLSRGYF